MLNKKQSKIAILSLLSIVLLSLWIGNIATITQSSDIFEDFTVAERYAVNANGTSINSGGLQPAIKGTDYGVSNKVWANVGYSLIYGGTTTIIGEGTTGFPHNKLETSQKYSTNPSVVPLTGGQRVYESSIYTKMAASTAYYWHNQKLIVTPAGWKPSSAVYGRSIMDNLVLENSAVKGAITAGGTGWLNPIMSSRSDPNTSNTAVKNGYYYKNSPSSFTYPVRTFLTYNKWKASGSWPASSYDTVRLYFEVKFSSPAIVEADETAPSVSLSPMSNSAYVYTQNVTITGSDTGGSGLARIYYQHKINDGAWSGQTNVSNGHVISLTGTGYNEIWGVSVDGAGNDKAAHGAYYYVDRTAPSAPAVNRSNSGWINTNPTFTVTGGADGHSGLASRQYKIGSGAWTGYSSTVTVTAEGATTIYGRTVDNVGNISSTTSTTVYRDTVVPTAPTINRSRTGWGTSNVTFTLTHGTDSSSGVMKSQYKIGSGAWTDYSGTVTVTNAGATTIYARTVDNAWNYSSQASTTVYKDATAPTGTTSISPSTWTKGNVTITLTASDTGGSGYYRTLLPNGTYSTSATPTYAVSANGTYSFTVYDNAGNSRAVSATVSNIDKTVPGGTISGNPTAWQNTNATLTLNATDSGGAGVKRVRVSGGTWVTGSTTTQVATANGTYSFEVEDNAGNTNTVSVNVTRIDKGVPSGSISISPSAWTNSDVTLTISGTDALSGVKRVRKSGGTWVTGSSTTQVASANGTYSFEVEDNAGNTRTVSYTVTNIDKVNPTHVSAVITGEKYKNGNDYWIDGNGTFNYEVRGTDDASGIRYLYGRFVGGTSDARGQHDVNGSDTHNNEFAVAPDIKFVSALRTYKSGNTAAARWVMSVTNVQNDYTVYYYHRDWAGNTIGYIDTGMNLRVDSTAPTTPSINLNPSTWTNGNVVVTIGHGTDTRSGVLRTEYRIGAGAWTTYTGPITISTVGSTTISARTIDRVGNISSTASAATRIDTTPPTGTITPSTLGWTSGTVTLSLSPSDTGGSGYYRTRLPNSSYTTSITPTYTVSANGTYSFVVEDNAGNSRTVSYTVTNIDKTPPTAPTINPSRTNWGVSNITFTITHGTDSQSGVAVSQYRVDGGAWIAYAGTVTISKSGISTVEARTIDNVGNISPITSINVFKDVTAPTVTANPTSSDWVDDKVVVNLTYTDTESGFGLTQYAWTLDSNTPTAAQWQNYTGPIEQSAQGIWYLHYKAVDAVGNQSIGTFGVYKVKRETGLKLTGLRVTPQVAVLKEGETSTIRKMSVTFTISNLLFPNHGKPINPVVTIKYGTDTVNTTLWTQTVQMPANGSTTKTVSLNNVILTPGKKIIAEVNGVVTGYVRFDEYHYSGMDPYADNKQSVSVLVTKPTADVCKLFLNDDTSRTVNSWTEEWSKTTQTGVVVPPYFNVTSRTTETEVVSYNETYRITSMKFRSKYTTDNRTLLMSDPAFTGYIDLDGWQTIRRPEDLGSAKETEDNIAKIKAGYGFELIAQTVYTTNRYVIPTGYVEAFSDYVSSPTYGNGYANYTVVSPSVTPVESPNVLYFSMFDTNGINRYCQEIPVVSVQGSWYSRTKTFERSEAANDRIWTEFHTLPAIYDVNVKTPNGTNIQDKFMGYEQEAPVDMSNKSYLNDTFKFKLQILGQDDIKSHYGN